MYKLKVGLAGLMQINFPGDKQAQLDRSVKELTSLSRQYGFEFYAYPKLIVTREDAEAARKALEAEGVEFLLIQTSSFAAGEAVLPLARMNAYIGLWAVPEPNQGPGQVPLNSFCGVNMYASIIRNYLKEYGIKYKWFYGFSDNYMFVERLRITVKALTAIQRMKKARVALIGGIAPGFNDLYFDERLIEKRLGVNIQRNHEFSEIQKMAVSYKPSQLEPDLEQVVSGYKCISEAKKENIEINARFYKAYMDFCKQYGYDALGISCWPKMQEEFNAVSCAIFGKLNQSGIPAACEGDLPGAVSMLLLKYIGEQTTTLMDLIAFDEADESVLLWHCGPSAVCLANEDGVCLKYHVQNTEDGKGNPQGLINDLVFRAEKATVMRITGEFDKMFLLDGKFFDGSKKSYQGSRGWLGELRLNREEIKARDLINTILVQGFQHHYPVIFGDITNELMETAAWLDLKMVDAVLYQDYMQNPAI